MKIAFLSATNPENKRLWSGTISSLYAILSSDYEVEWIGIPGYKVLSIIFSGLYFIKGKVYGKRFLYTHTFIYARIIAFIYSQRLKKNNYDLVFAPCTSTAIPYLKSKGKIVALDDATFDSLLGYYQYFSNLHPLNVETGRKLYAQYVKKCDAIIVASQWAKENAGNKYDVKNKLAILKFGANFPPIPVEYSEKYSRTGTIRILFAGVHWVTKGGPILMEAYRHLKKSGYKVKVVIVGCNPGIEDPDITVIPFLDKTKTEDREKFYTLYMNSDFFVLPTRFECAGIVFCEASAFGLPIIANDTGGVKSYVEEGVNGYCLRESADGAEYADKIIEVYSDEGRYFALRKSARKKYEDELNWNSWLCGFKKIINDLMK
jgi:glycosyltransferase involved in cell wall biosynthesis